MQIEDLSALSGSRPSPIDLPRLLDADVSDIAARMTGQPFPPLPRLPARVLLEHPPRHEASRRMPEAISAS